MTTRTRVLVVDDDPDIRNLISEFLLRHGFHAVAVADGLAMHAALHQQDIDLVILDVMLPGEDGLSLLKRLASEAGLPVIMLSALGDDADRIVGLELGADDYLSKPCNPRELLARVRAVLRRRSEPQLQNSKASGKSTIDFRGWALNLAKRELRSPKGLLVELSAGEFFLLRALLERPNQILSREHLLALSRGPDSASCDRAVDIQISRLRKKLAIEGDQIDIIRTIRHGGYMFQPDNSPL